MTVSDIIAKRKLRWNQKHSSEYDMKLTTAAIEKILTTPSLIKEIQAKPYLLIEVCFTIVDKDKHTVPFFLNDVQKDFISNYERYGSSRPYFILKGRQQGFTSLITAMQLAYTLVTKNFSGFTLADRNDNTLAIFNDKARMVYERLPELIKPSERFNSRNEMFFDKLNSSWRIATATGNVGRSRTLGFVHFSEVAFYDCSLSDLQAGIGEAMAKGAVCIYETTANGFGESKDLWDSQSCVNLFYEWWRTKEYRSADFSAIERADSWLSERIKLLEERGLDREQIAWYAQKYESYLDKRLIRQEYPVTPEEAFISSGNCVFDKELIDSQIARVRSLSEGRKGIFKYEKVCQGVMNDIGEKIAEEWVLRNIEFIESADGYIILHDEPKTVKDSNGYIIERTPYVLGGDTSGSGEDYYTGKVINNITGHTVATLRVQRIDEDIYAEQMLCLAKYYNDALIAIETNYSRQPVRIIEQKYNYSNMYKRERLDKSFDEVQKVTGFETTRTTKPIIIGNLVEQMRTEPACETDLETLRELLSFVRKENGSTEAMNGKHDDLVMALAIAHFCSKQQTKQMIKEKTPEDLFISSNFNIDNKKTNYVEW